MGSKARDEIMAGLRTRWAARPSQKSFPDVQSREAGRRRICYRDFAGDAANSEATSTPSANAILSSDSKVGFPVPSSRVLINAWRKRDSSARSYWDHDRSRRSRRRLRASNRLVCAGLRRLIRQDDAFRQHEQNTKC